MSSVDATQETKTNGLSLLSKYRFNRVVFETRNRTDALLDAPRKNIILIGMY